MAGSVRRRRKRSRASSAAGGAGSAGISSALRARWAGAKQGAAAARLVAAARHGLKRRALASGAGKGGMHPDSGAGARAPRRIACAAKAAGGRALT